MGLQILYHAMEAAAFILLCLDLDGQASLSISLQTCSGLSIAAMLLIVIKVYWVVWDYARCGQCADWSWWLESVAVVLLTGIAWCSTWRIAKVKAKSERNQSQSLSIFVLLQRGWIYAAAVALAFLTSFAVCFFSFGEWIAWAKDRPTQLMATFINFLQCTSLLPQLIMSHADGFVAPGLLKFLMLVGTKHILELLVDLWEVRRGLFVSHPASFLVGDIAAAAVLLDLLYIALKHKFACKRVLISEGLDLPL
eukprot:TRINITY_DN112046_c0_g1_i1.p1 TRINITY_DN112046_c0_g1~~TRINITY_DN112046_c0_g1_i1.p1  ORF type:complete len:252 (-),score=29.10 TRINITY_DN112046_c0_g1_i1:67-822(-)